jgi:hypothetical protein
VADTSEPVEAPPDEEAVEPDENGSITELLAQLGRDLSVLAFCEAHLAASRNMPEVRRAARDVAAALLAGIAFLTAFVFANVAGMLALTAVLPSWLAALILTLAWLGIGAAVAIALMVRAGHVTGWKWWRIFTAGPEESLKDLEQARADAEQAVLATLERLAPAITVEIASAAVPMASGAVSGALDVGGDLIEASDDMVEAIAEDLPGGGVVNQMWDVVLMPGRFGLRVATTVLKRDDSD